jgi:hypothetical protein
VCVCVGLVSQASHESVHAYLGLATTFSLRVPSLHVCVCAGFSGAFEPSCEAHVCACPDQVWALQKDAAASAASGPRYVDPRVGALTPRSFTEVCVLVCMCACVYVCMCGCVHLCMCACVGVGA